MDMGSITCAQIWVRMPYTRRGGGGGGARHKPVCTRVDWEGQKHWMVPCPRQGIEPRVLGFEFRRTNLRPPRNVAGSGGVSTGVTPCETSWLSADGHSANPPAARSKSPSLSPMPYPGLPLQKLNECGQPFPIYSQDRQTDR